MVDRALKQANFRYKASLEQLDYSIERGLDKNQVPRLASLDFIKEHKDLFITGSTGTEKSYLATAIGYHACQKGYRVLYVSTSKLMEQLKLAKAKGTILIDLKRIERMDLLILDDFGLQPFDSQSRIALLDIIADRHEKRSTIITSQIPVKEWYDIIGEKTIADAVLDRIGHQSLRVELFGKSLRRRKSKADCFFCENFDVITDKNDGLLRSVLTTLFLPLLTINFKGSFCLGKQGSILSVFPVEEETKKHA